MTRLGLAFVLVMACGCRRKHVETTYESDPQPAPAVEASGAADSPGVAGAAPRADRARLPDGGTLNGDPRGPRAAEWKAIVDAAMPEMQKCFDAAALPYGEIPISVHYTVEPRGEAGAVTAKGNAPQLTLDCCARVIEGLKFPAYGGPKVERDVAFTWFKRDPRAAARSDGGAAAAAAPAKAP